MFNYFHELSVFNDEWPYLDSSMNSLFVLFQILLLANQKALLRNTLSEPVLLPISLLVP